MRDLSFCRSAFSWVRTCKNSRSLLLLCVLWSEHHLSDHRIPAQVELPLGEGGPRSHNVWARCLRCRTTENCATWTRKSVCSLLLMAAPRKLLFYLVSDFLNNFIQLLLCGELICTLQHLMDEVKCDCSKLRNVSLHNFGAISM